MPRYALVLFALLIAACSPIAAPTRVAAVLAPNRVLDYWNTVTDQLDGTYSGQPWAFVARAGDSIRLQMNGTSADLTMTLQGPDGAVLARGNDVRLTVPADGVYVAVVRLAPSGMARYTLSLEYTDRPNPSHPTATVSPSASPTLTPVPTATTTPTPVYAALGALVGTLSNGTATDGAFSRPSDRHVYLFDGVAGHYANLLMARVSGSVDPVLTLFDPQGKPVATDDNSGGDGAALLRNIVLPSNGRYIVQATGDGQTGEYRLRLTTAPEREPVTPVIPPPTPTLAPTATPAPRPDRLVDHVPVPGRLTRPGDFVRYPIVALQGEVFTVGVTPVSDVPLLLEMELYNPSGELVASANSATSAANGDVIIPVYRAEQTGTYVVLVQSSTDAVGDFVIAYGTGASRDSVMRGPAVADTPANGEVVRRGLRDVWSVALIAGDEITVTANPLSATFDPALEIVAPDGAVLASDDNSGGGRAPLLSRVRAPQTGLYAIRVTGANAASSGAYSLVWRYVVAAPTPTPPAALVRLLSADDLVPRQTYLFYPFQGQSGQRLLVRAVARDGSPLDPVLALLDASGQVLAQADDNGDDLNPVLEFHVPETGTYTLRVNGYGETSGVVEISVDALY